MHLNHEALCPNKWRAGWLFCWCSRGKARGPIVPYLFVLVMEVLSLILEKEIRESHEFKFHCRCEKVKLTHLCFPDDLLVFCKGIVESIRALKSALYKLCRISGLKANDAKSQLFLSAIRSEERQLTASELGFSEGVLPVRYLGVPLISTKLKKVNCQMLVEKITGRISS